MKIISREVSIWGECPSRSIETYKIIERAGRTCWKSGESITDTSYEGFIKRITKAGHGAVLEMSNLVVAGLPFVDHKYLTEVIEEPVIYTGGNYRAWMEYFGLDDITHVVPVIRSHGGVVVHGEDIPKELRRVIVELICDRAESHELVRHRVMSFLQESQRYVKYESGIEFIRPLWYNAGKDFEVASSDFFKHCELSEKIYCRDRARGMKPEDARVNLPNSCATRLLMCGNLKEWKGVFALRGIEAKGVYPPVKGMISEVEETFKTNGWVA